MSEANPPTLNAIGVRLAAIENQLLGTTLTALKSNPTSDAHTYNKIFGHYTHGYMWPCVTLGCSSRAAAFSREHLIPAVLDLERVLSIQFHKGALFYDTGLAHLLSGNEDGYERFLAMADEEDFRRSGGSHKRGTSNLRSGGLAGQTIVKRMQNACDLLNGKITGANVDFVFVMGAPPVTAPKFDVWRQKIDELHQFELLRIIHDTEVILGIGYPNSPDVGNNPFIMLRLAKALAHIAQWVESCLTLWQGVAGPGGALGGKLKADTDFGGVLSAAAGNGEKFAGNCPRGVTVDAELRKLLADLALAPAGVERQWRLLRILYIVRNSTAHTIEPALAMYTDRALLLNLLQVVFLSVFTISQLKARPMP